MCFTALAHAPGRRLSCGLSRSSWPRWPLCWCSFGPMAQALIGHCKSRLSAVVSMLCYLGCILRSALWVSTRNSWHGRQSALLLGVTMATWQTLTAMPRIVAKDMQTKNKTHDLFAALHLCIDIICTTGRVSNMHLHRLQLSLLSSSRSRPWLPGFPRTLRLSSPEPLSHHKC